MECRSRGPIRRIGCRARESTGRCPDGSSCRAIQPAAFDHGRRVPGGSVPRKYFADAPGVRPGVVAPRAVCECPIGSCPIAPCGQRYTGRQFVRQQQVAHAAQYRRPPIPVRIVRIACPIRRAELPAPARDVSRYGEHSIGDRELRAAIARFAAAICRNVYAGKHPTLHFRGNHLALNPLDRIDGDRLARHPALRCVTLLDEAGSTNTLALEQIRREHLETPALILARRQSAGRGQSGRVWHSPPGNLLGSWILARSASQTDVTGWLAGLAAAIPLAICDSIRDPGIDPSPEPSRLSIKWPNDVLLGGKKVAGVLIETTVARHALWVVAGVGLNVNAPLPDPLDDPLSLNRTATTLRIELGCPVDLTTVALRLTDRILARSQQLESSPDGLWNDYHLRLAFRDSPVTVATDGGTITGVCTGVTREGALVLSCDGQQTEIRRGRIVMSPDA